MEEEQLDKLLWLYSQVLSNMTIWFLSNIMKSMVDNTDDSSAKDSEKDSFLSRFL